MYYAILFKAVWETLRSFGYTHYGVESGAIAVLHTWGQNLSLHPHIHCIVPAAGYSIKGQWKNIGKENKYLYPVRQLSAAFKGKFLDMLKRKLRKLDRLTGFDTHIQKAYKKDWVVYCEAPFSGVRQIIRYLGQYTHRIAISNQRILDIADGEVVFHAKDYRDNGTVKKTRLCGEEFLRRFLQHVEEQSGFDKLMTQADQKDGDAGQGTPSVEHRICPCCKKGKMIRVREIPRIRSPPGHLPSILKSYLL